MSEGPGFKGKLHFSNRYTFLHVHKETRYSFFFFFPLPWPSISPLFTETWVLEILVLLKENMSASVMINGVVKTSKL